MVPIVLLLLIAAESVFGAAVVNVQQADIREFPRPVDNGRQVSSYLTEGNFEIVDGGDSNIYIVTVQNILNDLANQSDDRSQALAVAETLAVLGELVSGISGDACAYANAVNSYVNYLGSGNPGALAAAVSSAVGRLSGAIDAIAQAASNPGSLRFSRGPSGGCSGGGRTYKFDSAWDSVLASASVNNIGLVNELYCAARRLYGAYNDRSNNVGAAASAAAITPVTNVVSRCLGPITNFLRATIGGNASAIANAAAVAKSAIANAARS